MISAKTSPAKSPFVRPKPDKNSPTSAESPPAPVATTKRPLDPYLESFPYLCEANKERPAVYQSPYAPGGGFTAAWMPNPNAPLPNPPQTLSQGFLMQRSSSQQEKVNTHMRQCSEHVAQVQRDKIRLQQEQLENMQRQRTHYQQPQSQVYSSMPAPSVGSRSQQHPPTAHYSSPMPNNHYSYDLSPPPFTHPHNLMHNSPPLEAQPPRRPTYGLQFQSPQDFQMQMQRESQQSSNGFDHFFKGLQNAAAAGHQRVGSQGGGGGGHGSPIKSEMGNGGEMLPMMKERY